MYKNRNRVPNKKKRVEKYDYSKRIMEFNISTICCKNNTNPMKRHHSKWYIYIDRHYLFLPDNPHKTIKSSFYSCHILVTRIHIFIPPFLQPSRYNLVSSQTKRSRNLPIFQDSIFLPYIHCQRCEQA